MDRLEGGGGGGGGRVQPPAAKRARSLGEGATAASPAAAAAAAGADDEDDDGAAEDGGGGGARVGARVREALRRGPTSADVDDYDEDAPEDRVALFLPHTAPINQLLVPRGAPHLVLSCAYDGSVRALDVNAGRSWCWLSGGGGGRRDAGVSALDVLADVAPSAAGGAGVACTAVVGMYDGGLGLLDPRAARLQNVVDEAHGRKVTSVSGAGAHHFVSSSSDSHVLLWDARAMRKPLASVRSEQAVTSTFVSPLATRAVSTCNDNKLRVWALDWSAPARPAMAQTSAIPHNNHTGRWLSAIRAVFVPFDDGVFVSGSMEREVEIYDAAKGARIGALTSEWLTAVPTLNAVHPTRPLILSGTASGRLHLWS